MKWAIIKGWIFEDFVMEFTSAELAKDAQTTPDLPVWKLSVDGATNAQGSGVGMILTSSKGIDIEYALRFGFRASNNEAEYEVIIAGLNLAHSMEVDQLKVCSDSQLVVKQIEDTYEAKSEKMILYLKKEWELLRKFILVQFRHILRVENLRADALAKLEPTSQEDLNKLTPVEHLSKPSVDLSSEEVSPVMSEPRWMDPIWDYLIEGLLPNDQKRHQNLGRGMPGSLFIWGPFISEAFLHPSSSALQGETPTTY